MMSYRREIDHGVITLQAQVRELAADLNELKGETRAWQASHDNTHQTEQTERTTGRRWIIGTGIAGVVALTAIAALLFDLLEHAHH